MSFPKKTENVLVYPLNTDLRGITILAVEDCPTTNQAIRLLTRSMGVRLRSADCLSSAARHLCIYRPSVLLVDIGLPDGSGANLIAQFNDEAHCPALIAMSGDHDRLATLSDSMVDGKLEKPLPTTIVFQKILRQAIEKRNARLDLEPFPDVFQSPPRSSNTTANRPTETITRDGPEAASIFSSDALS